MRAANLAAASPSNLDTGLAVRLASRSGALDAPTAGLAYGYAQGNLAILPKEYAEDFLRFCQANPKPCPLLGVSEAGNPRVPAVGVDLDIRTDIPRYRVWRDGELVDEPRDLKSVWRDDLVSFVHWLLVFIRGGAARRRRAGPPHFDESQRADVPHQHRDTACGALSRAARGLDAADEARGGDPRRQVTGRMPAVHGAPVHLGYPEQIGITDIAKPDYGDAVPVEKRGTAGVLGVRGHAASGDRRRESAVRDHACSRLHAGDGSEERAACCVAGGAWHKTCKQIRCIAFACILNFVQSECYARSAFLGGSCCAKVWTALSVRRLRGRRISDRIFALMMIMSVGRPFSLNIPAGDDFAAWCMAAMAFLGLAHTFKRGEMIRVGTADRAAARAHDAGRRNRRRSAIASAFILYFTWYAVQMTYDSWRFNDMAQGVVAVPLWIPQLGFCGGLADPRRSR